jgi:hypothetical protein
LARLFMSWSLQQVRRQELLDSITHGFIVSSRVSRVTLVGNLVMEWCFRLLGACQFVETNWGQRNGGVAGTGMGEGEH